MYFGWLFILELFQNVFLCYFSAKMDYLFLWFDDNFASLNNTKN